MAALPPNISFEDRHVLITGANSGLGYHAALHALELRASTLILAVRSLKLGEDTKEKLLAEPSIEALDPKTQIHIYELDLCSFDSVISFAAKLTSDLPRLNVALLNAGVFKCDMQLTKDGYETNLQVNFIANALLATLLLPFLERSATSLPSHLTIVGSQLNERHGFDKTPIPANIPIFTHLNDPETFSTIGRYGQTKFLVRSWIRQAAVKVDKSKVIVNCMCPGPTPTNLTRGLPWFIEPLVKFGQKIFFSSTEAAAWKLIYAVSSAAGEESHGGILVNNKIESVLPYLKTEEGLEFEKKLWKETLEKIEALSPGASERASL